MRIAHLSDPHILDLTGIEPARLLLNKRFTGWVNLKLHRGSKHKPQVVEAMMDDLRALQPDHVVVTGDITNLALEPEFERARAVFARLGLAPEQLSVVPGNHDVYTRGAERTQRFASFFAPHITSDLAVNDADNHPSGPFPFVRLRGEVALIGLSTAVARLPLISSGHAGERQLRALAQALEHPEVKRRTPVLLMHHPLLNPPSARAAFLRGLREGPRLRALLGRRQVVLLHGHLHDRAHRVLPLEGEGTLHHVGATSASLLHDGPDRMSGYNLYEIGAEGMASIRARIWDPAARQFVDGTVRQKSAEHAE